MLAFANMLEHFCKKPCNDHPVLLFIATTSKAFPMWLDNTPRVLR